MVGRRRCNLLGPNRGRKTGFKEQDPFFRLPGLDDIDSDCATRLNAAEGRATVGYGRIESAQRARLTRARQVRARVLFVRLFFHQVRRGTNEPRTRS